MLFALCDPTSLQAINNKKNKNNRHHHKNGGIRVGTEKESKYSWLINGMYRFKKWQYVF